MIKTHEAKHINLQSSSWACYVNNLNHIHVSMSKHNNVNHKSKCILREESVMIHHRKKSSFIHEECGTKRNYTWFITSNIRETNVNQHKGGRKQSHGLQTNVKNGKIKRLLLLRNPPETSSYLSLFYQLSNSQASLPFFDCPRAKLKSNLTSTSFSLQTKTSPNLPCSCLSFFFLSSAETLLLYPFLVVRFPLSLSLCYSPLLESKKNKLSFLSLT